MSQVVPSILPTVHQPRPPKFPNNPNEAKQVLRFVLRISCFVFRAVPSPSAHTPDQFLKLSYREYNKEKEKAGALVASAPNGTTRNNAQTDVAMRLRFSL